MKLYVIETMNESYEERIVVVVATNQYEAKQKVSEHLNKERWPSFNQNNFQVFEVADLETLDSEQTHFLFDSYGI